MNRQLSARHFIPLCRASAALRARLRQRVPYGVTILALSVYTIVRRLYGHRLSGYTLPYRCLRRPLAIRQVSQLPAKPY